MSLSTALVLLSGDTPRPTRVAVRRASGKRFSRSCGLGDSPLLGSWKSLTRKAGNLAKQTGRAVAQTGRVVSKVTTGDIGGAMAKVADMTGGKTSQTAKVVSDVIKSGRPTEPPTITTTGGGLSSLQTVTRGKMGYLYIGGGATLLIVGTLVVLSRKRG